MDGKVIGTITSASWGYRVSKNIAYAFIDPEFSDPGSKIQVEVVGKPVNAEVVVRELYDPEFERLKA